MALLRLWICRPAFLTFIRIGAQNRETLDTLHLIPKIERECIGADARDQEAAAEPVALWRGYVRDRTMKSCQPWGSRLINKTFRAMQESDKPQHSMVFPDIHGAFLDIVSMSVAIVFPQTARTEVQAYVLWSPVAPPQWHGLLDYRHCQCRVSLCTSQDSWCIPDCQRGFFFLKKVRGREGSSFVPKSHTQLASYSAESLHYAFLSHL